MAVQAIRKLKLAGDVPASTSAAICYCLCGPQLPLASVRTGSVAAKTERFRGGIVVTAVAKIAPEQTQTAAIASAKGPPSAELAFAPAIAAV